MHTNKLNKLINIWYVITITALIIFAIKYLFPIVLPFIIATAVAIVLKKPIKQLCKLTHIKQSLLSFLCVTLVLLVLVGSISLLIYSVYAWLSDLLKQLPDILPSLTAITDKIMRSISVWGENIPQTIKDSIHNIPSQLVSTSTRWITEFLSSTASRLPSVFISVFVTVISAYIITRDYTKLGHFVKSIIPNTVFDNLIKVRSIALNKTLGIIKGYSLLTLITFLQLLVGLLLLRCDHAIALSAVTALVDLLPVFGTGIVLIPWSIISFINNKTAFAVGILLIFLITTIVKNIISPKIVGDQIKLDSLCVLASMFIGYKFMGVWGMIITPFIAAVIRDIIME